MSFLKRNIRKVKHFFSCKKMPILTWSQLVPFEIIYRDTFLIHKSWSLTWHFLFVLHDNKAIEKSVYSVRWDFFFLSNFFLPFFFINKNIRICECIFLLEKYQAKWNVKFDEYKNIFHKRKSAFVWFWRVLFSTESIFKWDRQSKMECTWKLYFFSRTAARNLF